MRPSTKHALLHRLVALVGFGIAIGPFWGLPIIGEGPLWNFVVGFALGFVGIISAFGFGPWGRHFERLYVNEHRADIGKPPLP